MMKALFRLFGGLIIILLVLIIAVQATKSIILAFFPSLMQILGLSDNEMSVLVTGVMTLLIAAGAFIYNSINREEIIKIIIKIAMGVGLLILAYWAYPEGIMGTPIARVTVGDIGRLFIVIILGIAFLIDVFFLISDIRDY
jgi:hypothetical protein